MRKLRAHLLIATFGLLLFLVMGSHSPLIAKDDISVSQDGEKTVYTIGAGEDTAAQQERDRAEAMEMLRNMPIVIDGRQDKPMPRQPQSTIPARPVKPAPAPVH